MKTDIQNFEHIKTLIFNFYEDLGNDILLKDIFINRLGNGDWSEHLMRISYFWETILFAGTQYKGNSFLPHSTMALEQKHFDKWLELFNKNVDELFEGEKANLAKEKANLMAILFMSKINYYKENGAMPLM